MIIKKPYAFLIKYFQLIHLAMFIGITYLAYKTYNIYSFFFNYAKSGTYTYVVNMAFKYINVIMIIITIFLIAFLLLIYFLMKQKEKKVLIYLLATIYYFLMFCGFIFFIGVFNRLEFSNYNNQYLVLFRDITMILYYLNYVFLALTFIRGFGFNVKKFNFEKDLKELDISDSDREEIEVKGIDYENINIALRKGKRNIGYYIKENSFILTIFLIIVILSTSAYVAFTSLVVNKIYNINESVLINKLEFIVNNYYVVDKDVNGNEIKKNKKFVVVDLNVNNNNQASYILDLSYTRLKIDNNYVYYKNNFGSKFKEFGNLYKKQTIKNNSKNNFILVFEVNQKDNDIILQLFEGKKNNGKEVIMSYKDVKFIPYEFKSEDLGDYHLNDKIKLDKTYYQKGEFSVTNVEVLDIENYTYKKCINDKCNEYNKSVVASNNKKILKISYDLNIDKDIFSYLNLEGNSKVKGNLINDITPDNYKDNIVLLEVPNSVITDNLVLDFNIRNVKFRISVN